MAGVHRVLNGYTNGYRHDRVDDMAQRKRRQYGTGSVQQLEDGRWIGVFEAGYTKTGGRRRIKVTAKTEAEAKTKLKLRQREVAAEDDTDADPRTTVKAWTETWLRMTVTHLRPKSYATDRSAITQWIIPTIGHRRLAQVTPGDVRAVHDAMRKASLSTSSIQRAHRTMTSMFKAAIVEGHQVPQRVLATKAPKAAVSDRGDMPLADALRLLHAASFLPHGSRWAFAFLTGQRQAECLGLTWDCVDLDAGLARVEWQLQPLPYNVPRDRQSGFRIPDGYEVRQLEGRLHLVRPKTKSGYRVAPLVPGLREALVEWRAVSPPSPHGLVWPTASGRPVVDTDDRAEWYRMQDELGIKHPSGRHYYPHEARHTTATVLMEAGIDPHQATAIMGHSSIVTTRGYQHPSERPALAALQAVADVLSVTGRPAAS